MTYASTDASPRGAIVLGSISVARRPGRSWRWTRCPPAFAVGPATPSPIPANAATSGERRVAILAVIRMTGSSK